MYIKKIISNMKTYLENIFTGNRFVVAETQRGYILYERKNFDQVCEGLRYESPIPIASFRSYAKAFAFLTEKNQEDSEFMKGFVVGYDVSCPTDLVDYDEEW